MDAYIDELLFEGGEVTILMSGCNYRCRFCNRPGLLEFREQQPLREVLAQLDRAAPRQLRISGGEPLLQRQALLALLRHAKQRGWHTILETNGSKPVVIQQLLAEELVDHFFIDVKAPAHLFAHITRAGTFFQPASELFTDFTKTLQHFTKPRTASLTFTTVITPGLLYKKEDLLTLGALLAPCNAPWILKPFTPARVVEKSLRGVSPPTIRFLATLAGFLKRAYPGLDVQVDDRE